MYAQGAGRWRSNWFNASGTWNSNGPEASLLKSDILRISDCDLLNMATGRISGPHGDESNTSTPPMSTSYTLDVGKEVYLKGGDITTDGIIAFWPVSYDETPDLKHGIDNTNLNLRDNDGNVLLHISFRRAENAIVFNTKKVGVGWGQEERVPLDGKIATPASNTAIMVFDFGNHYQILIDYRSVHSYNKRLAGKNVRSISYGVNPGQTPVFGNRMQVVTYSSLELIMDQLYSSGSPISNSMYGYYTISPLTASYKCVEGNPNSENQEVWLATGNAGRPEVKWQVGGEGDWQGVAWIKNAKSGWYIRSSQDPKAVTSGTSLITSSSSPSSLPIWNVTQSNDAYISSALFTSIRSEFGNLCWTLNERQKVGPAVPGSSCGVMTTLPRLT
ncbi:hypothetical protein HD554DRAFT_2043017 [Boletus coccyginus]|nr:hypothetical protein HD554DRAFT_2043017 [Boletus coccyginus]